jgi:hypothetical protein
VTITYVGAGTAATANNASVTPGTPAGLAVGDLVLIDVSIRDTPTGVVVAPTGWSKVHTEGSHSILGRFWQSGDSVPLVGFTGGVTNADTIARAFAFRGVSSDQITAAAQASQTNTSAQNVAYPALAVPGDGEAVVLAVWKQDDATALSTPSGFTAIGLTAPTAGDDALQGLFYQIQTTDTDLTSGSITVTGGAAAVSNAIVLALKPAAAIAVATQDVYPPRVLVTVSGLTIGDSVTLYREVAGVRTAVRGASTDSAIDPAFIAVDAELPFGQPVKYVAVVEGQAEYATTATTYTLPGGKVALSDAISGAAAEVTIMAEGDKTYARNSTRFNVGGRNIMVSGPQGQAEGTYELFVESTSSRDNLMDLLANATEGVIQIRQPGTEDAFGQPYDGVDAYLAIDRVTQSRFSQDGTDPRRLFTIEYAEVDGWAAMLEARGYTLGDIATYVGATGTLQDIANFNGAGGTLLDIAQADWS